MTTPWDLVFGQNNSKGKADYATKRQAYAEAYDKLRKEHGSVWLQYRNIPRPEGSTIGNGTEIDTSKFSHQVRVVVLKVYQYFHQHRMLDLLRQMFPP